MKATLIAGLIFGFSCNAPPLETCKCTPSGPDETTHWGGNQVIVFKESKVYRSLRGTVQIVDKPLSNVLVEIFDHPDHLLLDYPKNEEEKAKQHRIAACKTGDDGKFCFENVPKGKYEIRTSIDAGWNVTYVWLQVDGKNRRGTNVGIEVQMQVGT
ncbi:MAG TPA: hypothetical protein VKF81_07730 [Blastocatellia bacterium]|nr:hypothetical protein [Blastocatellia bacterium]